MFFVSRLAAVVRPRPAAVGRRAVVVPIVRVDAAAVAALSAASGTGGRVLAVHVTHAGERAACVALVDAWDACGVAVPLSVVYAEDSASVAEPIVTFVRGLPERDAIVRFPGTPARHRPAGDRREQLSRVLRAAGIEVESTAAGTERPAGVRTKGRLAPAA